jgi:hypothetical protein
MDRRTFLRAAGTASALAVAGCLGSETDGSSGPPSRGTDTPGPQTPPSRPASLPDGVYVQRYLEGMAMQGTATRGGYAVGVMYAVPHVFWTVTGSRRERVAKSGNVHLMAVVWDPETGTVLPEAGVSVELTRDGDLVSQEVIYPMLSQRMGFHWGGNFGLAGDGAYTVRVSVGGLAIRPTGRFAGRFSEPATVELPLVFDDEQRSKVTTEPLAAFGQRGAVRPMEMGAIPRARAPARSDLPGTVLGETTRDDAVFLSTLLSGADARRFGGDDYLAVSARTPYNDTVLPSMGIDLRVSRSGTTVFEGALERTLDPALDYHYGATVDGGLRSGDELELAVTTPPQVARHEGYERAFLRMDRPMTLTVP